MLAPRLDATRQQMPRGGLSCVDLLAREAQLPQRGGVIEHTGKLRCMASDVDPLKAHGPALPAIDAGVGNHVDLATLGEADHVGRAVPRWVQ